MIEKISDSTPLAPGAVAVNRHPPPTLEATRLVKVANPGVVGDSPGVVVCVNDPPENAHVPVVTVIVTGIPGWPTGVMGEIDTLIVGVIGVPTPVVVGCDTQVRVYIGVTTFGVTVKGLLVMSAAAAVVELS